MNNLTFKQVDVFTQKPFWGNPVAIVIGAEALQTEAMQQIAAWTNLSETTFVLTPSSSLADYRLRIFSPKQELPFAGHPTIGSAHAVIESGFAAPKNGRLRQECLAGVLNLSIDETPSGKKIMVQAPPARISSVNEDLAERLRNALGKGSFARTPPLRVDVGVVWLVMKMQDADSLGGLTPDIASLIEISDAARVTGVTVFARANDGQSTIYVRSFAPAQGVPEDPVCGSGNASVAAFLIHSGLIEEVGCQYVARQGMEVGRAGQVAVRVSERSIEIGGYAVTCIDGTLRVQ